MAPFLRFYVRIRFDLIPNGAPPHAAILKRDPHVLARVHQQGPQRFEILRSAGLVSKLRPD